jgi:hypothetical protein
MIVLARGSITNSDELAPYVADEMGVIKQLKGRRRDQNRLPARRRPRNVRHPRGESIDAIRERVETLPFVVEGLMTLEYEEIYAI